MKKTNDNQAVIKWLSIGAVFGMIAASGLLAAIGWLNPRPEWIHGDCCDELKICHEKSMGVR